MSAKFIRLSHSSDYVVLWVLIRAHSKALLLVLLSEVSTPMHTVTKVKRNVQKLTLVGFEPMTPSRGAQINALDH